LDKVALIIGIILGIVGLYKIDIVLIAGLNYFGKYVFFGLFNLFIVYIYYFSFKKSKFWKKGKEYKNEKQNIKRNLTILT